MEGWVGGSAMVEGWVARLGWISNMVVDRAQVSRSSRIRFSRPFVCSKSVG